MASSSAPLPATDDFFVYAVDLEPEGLDRSLPARQSKELLEQDAI